MTVLEYIRDFLPNHFNVHKSFGVIAELVFNYEKIEHPIFSNENFKSLRERAELAIPYQINDLKERERVLNVLELILCIHRQEKHGEDYNNRIKELKSTTILTIDEIDIVSGTRGFWNG